ncbi:hypothetical protein [Sphaerochaeta halotolerans]|nr:hypothetical protein [Sphaerochaeta halotolerans]MXI87004.1 hypothetical protein [Sphaerochaeta halotolerans]
MSISLMANKKGLTERETEKPWRFRWLHTTKKAIRKKVSPKRAFSS